MPQKFKVPALFLIGMLVLIAGTQDVNGRDRSGQDSSVMIAGEALRVFLDCDECDFNFIRKNITFVNYMRDPENAQVHVLVTDDDTGGGGTKFTINLLGRSEFEGTDQSLIHISELSDSEDTINKDITRILKMGLMPYVARTPEAKKIKISYDDNGKKIVERTGHDPWKSWIFSIDLSGSVDAEESQNEISLVNAFQADRTTEEWKFRSEIKLEYDEENYEDDGEKIKSILRQSESDFSLVKSIDEHWSAGIETGVNSTTYKNIDLSVQVASAIEYNIFPWKYLDRKIFTVGYFIGLRSFYYLEETVFNKTKEMLPYEALDFELELRQPWGEVDARMEGSHYFRDLDQYQIEFNTDVSFWITKGFSFSIDLETKSIHDQLYLAKGDASLEEILLKRRQLSTNYDVKLSIGIRYTFGSIYNNTVNRRL